MGSFPEAGRKVRTRSLIHPFANMPDLPTADLLPCPFCADSASLDFMSAATDTIFVSCECGGEGPAGASEDEATALWNRRALAVPRDANARLDGIAHITAGIVRFPVMGAQRTVDNGVLLRIHQLATGKTNQ